jgi:hypothetical protein
MGMNRARTDKHAQVSGTLGPVSLQHVEECGHELIHLGGHELAVALEDELQHRHCPREDSVTLRSTGRRALASIRSS